MQISNTFHKGTPRVLGTQIMKHPETTQVPSSVPVPGTASLTVASSRTSVNGAMQSALMCGFSCSAQHF